MEQLVRSVTSWILKAGEQIKAAVAEDNLKVDTKSDRKDLVTDIDQQTQDFLIEKIKAFDPQAKVLAEENGLNTLDDFSGRVFIIDPIDGTMNFVLERENFCIMIAVQEDGVGQLGFIYDVMKGELLWGGPEIGIYLNDRPVKRSQNLKLEEGLISVNAEMFLENRHNEHEMVNRALGLRMTGCAGIEMMALILGRRAGVVSNLSPWDYAAGSVLLGALGFRMSHLSGRPLALNGRELFLAGTPNAYEEMLALVQST